MAADDEDFYRAYARANSWDYPYEPAQRADVSKMSSPARCTRCSKVYDMGKVTVVARYTDCSVWKCPGCGITVDNRPPGWGDHHYVELDRDGREKRPHPREGG